jgi:TRAP-type mannitol/chloroaromatic compound transport system permease small subunit
MRYAFDRGGIVLQESVMYLHAAVFMLAIPYTLKEDAHVRVDLVYSRLSPRGKTWVDLFGHLFFLVPVAAAILYLSYPYVVRSWQIGEGSSEVGGIPAVFLLKSLVPLMATLLLAQGSAEIFRCICRLLGRDV